jgi:cytochrome c
MMRMHRGMRGGEAVRRALPFVCAAAMMLLAACGTRTERMSERETSALTGGGNAHRGRLAMRRYGCNACHTIPGVAGAAANVGPPLATVGSRVYIAGVMSNTPANMMRWIENPPGVDSLTAMPNLGVTENDARDIAAYLYSLR